MFLKNYLEAVKPERTFFNVMMAAAGFLLASKWHIDWALALAAIAGTSLLVMSGCLANNATDTRLDMAMPRTRRRASATGAVPARNLVLLAVVFGVAGLALLVVWVNWLTALLGIIAYVDYVVIYAWTKRTTPWSTLAGTPAGALPLCAGYTAVVGRFNATALALALVMVCWQMVHFYAIGIYRLKDYKAGGLPIWPARYGLRNTQVWMLAYAVLYLFAISWLDATGTMGAVFLGSGTLLGLYWLWLGVTGFRSLQPEKWARRMFSASLLILLLLAIDIAAAPLLP
ncbi:MAG TPA: heme o synthase [Candidatus Saccharimonadales bacterium]|jgi:protoheme IX farnesyltransferase